MYKIYCDEYLLYTPLIEGLTLQDPKAQLELNKAGELNFGILATHPYFSQLNKLNSIITLVDDDEIIFRGRILNDESGFYNDKTIVCEGELGFLNDSTQRPYNFSGTPAELFTQFITNHNAQVEATKQFVVGNITVTDPNDYIARSDTTYPNTWESINSKLIDTHGGYLWVRHEEDGNYIDYLADFSTLNTQKIETGVNLLSFKKTLKGEDIATVIIPLGAKLKDDEGNDTDERLTIESVNSGLDYIADPTAVAAYGLISKTVTWDDVTVAENLLTKATDYLATSINLEGSIEITALDLAAVSGDTSFRIGSYIKTNSPQHGVDDETFLIQKLELSISNPADNALTLDGSFTTFTERQISTENAIKSINADYIKNAQLVNVKSEVSSTIEQAADQIRTEVSQTYVTQDEYGDYVTKKSTEMTQTVDGWSYQFNEITTTVNSQGDDLVTEVEERKKLIRLDNGDIVLGKSDSAITIRIENDQVAFYSNGARISHWEVNANGVPEFQVTDGRFLNSLRLGNFAFMPRSNGNLSFGKVG